MTRYRYQGRPDRPVPFGILIDRSFGDEFDAELDQETHNYLVGGGALKVVPSPKTETKVLPKAEPKSEPKVETKVVEQSKAETKEAPRAETPKPSAKR